MTVRATGHEAIRKTMALLTCFVLVAGAAPGLGAQESTAAFVGVILDPTGQPAVGFKVILRDVASNREFMSDPTDEGGNYSARVPVGGRYKLAGVVASDGVTKLPVQDVPPLNVLMPGTTRLNVRFTSGPTPAPAIAGAPPPVEEKKDKKAVATPWYKRPGPITGMVLGGAAIVALAAGGGGSSEPASQSAPTPEP
jgi:hypothetical protein